MKFRFTTFNHSPQGQRAVQDLADITGNQIAALGHEVSWSDKPDFIADGLNVVFESFADPRYPALPAISEAYARGCRFLYVATEEPSESGAFNDAPDQGMRDRQMAFPDACRYARGILHLVAGERVTAWYSRWAPAAYAELGHAPGLVRYLPGEPDYDFGFFGKRTPRRAEMLARLAERGSVIAVHDFQPSAYRDQIMRRARIIVQLREWNTSGVISSSRVTTAMSLGRPVIAEPHSGAGQWAEIAQVSESVDKFYDDAVAALADWRALYRRQFDAFARLMTPERCVGEPLKRIGVL